MSSLPPERDFARSLLRRAIEDLDALLALYEHGGIADAVLGFHAQQAVEKALKAALVATGWSLRRTHDLRFLLDQADEVGIDVAEEVRTARWLTPWAVEARYDDFLEESLDREAAVSAARSAVAWASAYIES